MFAMRTPHVPCDTTCRTLADRAEPLLLEVSVEAGTTFQP